MSSILYQTLYEHQNNQITRFMVDHRNVYNKPMVFST